MTPLVELYPLLSVILRALALLSEALMIGGSIFRFSILREHCNSKLGKRIARLVMLAAAMLALSEIGYLTITSSMLIAVTNLLWTQVYGASFFVWGAVAVAGAGICGAFALGSGAKYASTVGASLTLAAAIMTSHSAARMEHRTLLIGVTAAHHLAGDAWIGAMPYLLLALSQTSEESIYRSILARFSRMAMIAVGVLLAAGITMSRLYVGVAAAMAGTSYGVMLLSKASLTAFVIWLGMLNRRNVRAMSVEAAPGSPRLRRFVEVEAGIGITIILAAASLTSTPPAIDVLADRVSRQEIENRLKPRWPHMRTPAFAELSPATPLGSYSGAPQVRKDTVADIAWSEYNHHWAGLIMLTIGVLSLFARQWRWARAWPLAFLALALFLLIRSDSENWPLGPRGFWESFRVAEVAMHRVFVLLIVIFAFFEWRCQTNPSEGQRARLVFPLVCAVGGALLLTHSHSLGNAKEEFLAELSHLPLAILAVLAGWSRWLEVRVKEPPAFLGWVYPVCFTLIGAILLNYREM